MNCIETISYGIGEMTSQELYYRYSKCTNRFIAKRAQKTVRIMLAGE
jgi:hypothetical protein